MKRTFITMTKIESKKPWWLTGLNCVFMCLVLGYIVKFSNESINRNISPYDEVFKIAQIACIIPLSIFGLAVLILFIRLVRDYFQQQAKYSIKSILILTLCVGIFCSIYACFGLGVVLLVFSGMYIWILSIWYWKAHIR
jgi:hypothetical protein